MIGLRRDSRTHHNRTPGYPTLARAQRRLRSPCGGYSRTPFNRRSRQAMNTPPNAAAATIKDACAQP